MIIQNINIISNKKINSAPSKYYHSTSYRKTVDWVMKADGPWPQKIRPLINSGRYFLKGQVLVGLPEEEKQLKYLSEHNDAQEVDHIAEEINDLFNLGQASSEGDKPWSNWLLINTPSPLGLRPVISYNSIDIAKSKLLLLAESLDSSVLLTELYPILLNNRWIPASTTILAWKMIKILPMVAAFRHDITKLEIFQFLSVSSQFGFCLHKSLKEDTKINSTVSPEVIEYLERQTQIMRDISFTFFTCENYENWG